MWEDRSGNFNKTETSKDRLYPVIFAIDSMDRKLENKIVCQFSPMLCNVLVCKISDECLGLKTIMHIIHGEFLRLQNIKRDESQVKYLRI